MARGMDKATRIMITEITWGSRFLVITRPVGVPRHREARLNSRSRMITIWLRMNRAVGSHPVKHMAKIMVPTLGFNK